MDSQNVAVFGHTAAVCKPSPVVCFPCCDVHHCWEKDQDDDFAVLCNIDL